MGPQGRFFLGFIAPLVCQNPGAREPMGPMGPKGDPQGGPWAGPHAQSQINLTKILKIYNNFFFTKFEYQDK